MQATIRPKPAHDRPRYAWSLGTAASLMLALTSAVAVHDNVPTGSQIFELGDGATPTHAGSADILGSAGQPGPDWADIFNASGGVTNLHGGIAATFLLDDRSPGNAIDKTTFAGSNKNDDAIGSWHWNKGNNPPKDDLANTYAWAGSANPSNPHVVAYVGLERLDPSGDSHVDIEFFQDQVGLDEGVPCDDAGNDATPCAFVGNRTDGDLLMSMDFTRGGDLGSVNLYIFNGSTHAYDLLENVTVVFPNGTVIHEGCNGVAAAANLSADAMCSFNNGGPIDGGPWPNYDNHGNIITMIPRNGFTEFGIDLTVAGNGTTPCISTIMAKTRSSQSFTAELKDFSGPFPFPVCGANIAIEPDAVNPVGAAHTFNVTVNTSTAGVVAPAPDGTLVNVTLTASGGAVVSPISDTCAGTGTISGKCNVTFTSYTPGTVIGHASANVSFGGLTIHVETNGTAGNSGNATKVFVGRPIMKISGFGYDNTPTDSSPSTGIVNGTTNYTIRMKNYGNVSANLTTWLNVSLPGGTPATGTFGVISVTGTPNSGPTPPASCVTSCNFTWLDRPVAPGAEIVFVVEVKYQGVPDGTVVRASVNAIYTVLGFTPRQASGAPATIEFTVQQD